MDEPVMSEILQELKDIKKLLAGQFYIEGNQAAQIMRLGAMGFGPTAIADMINTTANTVNVALARARKAKKKSRRS